MVPGPRRGRKRCGILAAMNAALSLAWLARAIAKRGRTLVHAAPRVPDALLDFHAEAYVSRRRPSYDRSMAGQPKQAYLVRGGDGRMATVIAQSERSALNDWIRDHNPPHGTRVHIKVRGANGGWTEYKISR